MTAKRFGLAFALFMPCLVGCVPKMTVEMIRDHKAERPPELDALQAFHGQWKSTGEARFHGMENPLPTTGTSTALWEADGWYLVERSNFTMGEDVSEGQGIGVWTYDPKIKKYRNWWFDSMGSNGDGTSTYDAETKTWTMHATSHSADGSSTGKGTIKLIDENTMEWTWTEYVGLTKFMEIKGTSTRMSP